MCDKFVCKSLGGGSKILRSSLQNIELFEPGHSRITPIRDLMNTIVAPDSFPCYSFPMNEVIFVPSISWHMRNVIASKQNPTRAFVNFTYLNAVKLINASTIIFTDGSRSNDQTGAAMYVNDNISLKRRLREPASVFDAELLAIMLAVEYINNCSPNSFIIASDSMSVLLALENNIISTKASLLMYRCRTLLARLNNLHYKITLLWVPAHYGIDGNEKADELAKLASSEDMAIVSSDALNWSSHLSQIKNAYAEKWQTRWSQGDLGRFCHAVIPRTKLRPWFKKFVGSSQRAELRTASRIISNHYTFKNHLNRFSITDNALCSCGAYESVDHLLFLCPDNCIARPQLLSQLSKDGFSAPYHTLHILSKTTSPVTLSHIHKFFIVNELKI